MSAITLSDFSVNSITLTINPTYFLSTLVFLLSIQASFLLIQAALVLIQAPLCQPGWSISQSVSYQLSDILN